MSAVEAVRPASAYPAPGRLRASMRHDRQLWLGSLIIGAIALLAVAAPLITPYDPIAADPNSVLLPPDLVHPFGTDLSGMDILSRVLFAARLDLVVAVVGTGLA